MKLAPYNLLMLSGDASIAYSDDGAFYQMLGRFSHYWQRIDILTPSHPEAKRRIIHENVYVQPAPYHRLLQPFFIKERGEALFKERNYHLVVSHDFGFFYNGIGAWWLLHGKTIPLVSEIHHIEGYPIATNQREKWWRKAAQFYLPWMAERAAAIRVVNHELPKQLADFGVPPEKVRVLYSLYLDFKHYQPQAVPKAYDLLFVGRLATNKGILLLLDALEIVKQTHPHITLAIRGRGELEKGIQYRREQRGLEENILFLPRYSDAEMPDLYSQARILVCASTVEGNPRVTIEAMACGVPVISTRVGIMPEVIQDGENGFLVDWSPQDIAAKIRLLLEDAVLAERIAQAGRESVQRFSADTVIRDYALGYHQVIESAPQ